MKNSLHFQQVAAISEAIAIQDDYSFWVFEQQVQVPYIQPYLKWNQPLQEFGQNPGDEAQLHANLTSQLASSIYTHFYVHGKVSPDNLTQPPHHVGTPEATQTFTDQLSAHNQTQEGRDWFWRVYALDAQGNAFIEKNGDVQVLVPNQYELANPAEQQLQVNSYVHLKVQKEYRDLQPTFYHVRSQEPMLMEESIVRFYWNLEPSGAPVLIKALTERFNQYRVPFSFKTQNHAGGYQRSDSAVLYFSKRYFRMASLLLRSVYPQVKAYLKPEVPLFSYRIADGFSFAEDPGKNQSFGMSRSQLIAEGIVKAYQQARNGKSAQLEAVIGHLEQNGLDLSALHLNPHAHFPYDFSSLV